MVSRLLRQERAGQPALSAVNLPQRKFPVKKLSFFLLSVSLVGCGGGSSSSPPGPPPEMKVIQMNIPRRNHAATLLNDGRVLLVGGFDDNNQIVERAEIYDPSANEFIRIGNVNLSVGSITATLLGNDNVLIVGGSNGYIFNPSDNSFTVTGSPNRPRNGHTATRLENGNVLVVGGLNVLNNTAEIYNVASGTFGLTGNTLVESYEIPQHFFSMGMY